MDPFRETADQLDAGKRRLDACRRLADELLQEWDSLNEDGVEGALPSPAALGAVTETLLRKLVFARH